MDRTTIDALADQPTTTIDREELEALRIDAAVGALALHLAELRTGSDRRRTPRTTPDRRRTALDLDAAREAWDRH